MRQKTRRRRARTPGSHGRTECTRFSVRSADVGWAHRRSRRPRAKPQGEPAETRDLARTRLALRGDARGGTRRRANRCAGMATRRLPRTERPCSKDCAQAASGASPARCGPGDSGGPRVASAVRPTRRQGVRRVDAPPLNRGGVVALLARWFTGRMRTACGPSWRGAHGSALAGAPGRQWIPRGRSGLAGSSSRASPRASTARGVGARSAKPGGARTSKAQRDRADRSGQSAKAAAPRIALAARTAWATPRDPSTTRRCTNAPLAECGPAPQDEVRVVTVRGRSSSRGPPASTRGAARRRSPRRQVDSSKATPGDRRSLSCFVAPGPRSVHHAPVSATPRGPIARRGPRIAAAASVPTAASAGLGSCGAVKKSASPPTKRALPARNAPTSTS